MKITKIARESCPAALFIGQKYQDYANWGEFWEHGWFDTLEKLPGLLPINDDGYTEAVHIVDGRPEFWVGMFFAPDTPVPEEFASVSMEPKEYAVCYLYGSETSGELFSMEAHELCLDALNREGLRRREDDWCFKRCNCPRFTTPDENGNVVLDYGLSIYE